MVQCSALLLDDSITSAQGIGCTDHSGTEHAGVLGFGQGGQPTTLIIHLRSQRNAWNSCWILIEWLILDAIAPAELPGSRPPDGLQATAG